MRNFTTLILTTCFVLIANSIQAQSDDILNLLIRKQVITQEEADSIRADNAIKAQASKERQKLFGINARKEFQLSGYSQVRFQSLQEAGRIDYADIRRSRFDIKGNVASNWDYRVQFDLAGTPKLLDAFAGFKPFEFLRLQAGQFKIPFSQENLIGSHSMELIDRSQVVEALVARGRDVIGNHNGRDIGVQASGSLLKIRDRYIVDYFIGGFNGNGINNTDNNEPKDLAARLVLHPVKGLDLGASWYNGYDKFGTPAVNHVRTRIGGELTYIYKFASIRSEYIQGEDGAIEREGYYIQGAAFIYKRKVQLVAKYDFYDPDKNKDNDASKYYISGINYYFNEFAKIQVNVSNREEETNNFNNDLINVQLQVGF